MKKLVALHGSCYETALCMHIKAGHSRPTSETPFKWRFADGPIVAGDCTCLLVGRLQFPVIIDMASGPGIS